MVSVLVENAAALDISGVPRSTRSYHIDSVFITYDELQRYVYHQQLNV